MTGLFFLWYLDLRPVSLFESSAFLCKDLEALNLRLRSVTKYTELRSRAH